MYDFFSIYILRYGKWEDYRSAVALDKQDPRWHIVHALHELYVHGPFESVNDIKITLRWYELVEDEDGHNVKEVDEEDGSTHNFECKVETEITWSETDFESFGDFRDSFLSSKFKV